MPENISTTLSTAQRWWLLTVLALAQLMIALDTTIVTIALPSAQAELGFPDSSRQWIITGYALTFGGLLLLSGRLGDRWGRKKTLIAGLVGFAVASAIGGAAPSIELLIAARIAQGAFAALLAPSALALVSVSFDDDEGRSRAFGIFGAVSMVGTTIGLLLGGALTEALSWRWTMYINTVIAVPAILGAFLLLPRTAEGTRQRLDIPGAITVTGGFFTLVLGTSQAESAGWSAPLTITYLVVAAVLLVAFVAIQAHTHTPLLPLRVIVNRRRGSALIALLLSSAGLFTTFLFLPYYLQITLGYSQLLTGVAFLPVPIALVTSAVFIGPSLTSKFTARPVIPLGLTIAGVGALLLVRLGATATYVTDLLPSLLLIGAGIGLVVATATGSATADVDPADAGAAAASVNAAQQIGGSVGVAVLSTIAGSAAAAFLAEHPGQETVSPVYGYATAYAGVSVLFLMGALLALVIHPKKSAA
ncbi:MAG: MFS transporter [Ancrocorticia sp.]